jgi:hypothetical protein
MASSAGHSDSCPMAKVPRCSRLTCPGKTEPAPLAGWDPGPGASPICLQSWVPRQMCVPGASPVGTCPSVADQSGLGPALQTPLLSTPLPHLARLCKGGAVAVVRTLRSTLSVLVTQPQLSLWGRRWWVTHCSGGTRVGS